MSVKDYLLDNFEDIAGDGDFVAVLNKPGYNKLISVIIAKQDADLFVKDVESLTDDDLTFGDGTTLMTIARLTEGSSSVDSVTDDYQDFIEYGILPSIFAIMKFGEKFGEDSNNKNKK